MKNLGIIILNTLILFIIINVLIGFTWPIVSDLRNKEHSYNDEQIKLLDLNENDLVLLQNETWRKDYKFIFVPFIGHSEIDKKGKFVNFTIKNGRAINRPKNCEKNIYVYGGSTTFGYNVTDYQTIAAYLQQGLRNDKCVYNHGRAGFNSTQENNLIFSHLEEGRKIDFAIFLDGVNEVCGGHQFANQLEANFSKLMEKPYYLWKDSTRTFVYSLPLYQLYLKFFDSDWLTNVNNKEYLSLETCEKKIPLNVLFENRLKLRNSICESFKVNCYTFLQPMPGASGKRSSSITVESEKFFKKKYSILKKAKGNFIDINYILNANNNVSYIDNVHYTPETNEKIAQEIKKIIFNR